MCLSIAIQLPDNVLARGEHCGFEWVVTNNGSGFRCGYVRVPPGHPWHGLEYHDVDANVHGGLTFSEEDVSCDKGGPDDAWWHGFDCAHSGDAPDPELDGCGKRGEMDFAFSMFGMHSDGGGAVRTQEYVEGQCRSLCEQAAAAGDT